MENGVSNGVFILTDDGHSGSFVSRACRTKRESFKD